MLFRNRNLIFLNKKTSIFIGIFLGLLLTTFLHKSIQSTNNATIDPGEFALGTTTTSKYGFVKNFRIHCSGPLDEEECILGSTNSKKILNMLYLGNSQVHSINQIKSNDKTVVEILHNYFIKSDFYVTGFTQANASLEEHYLLFEHLRHKMKVKYLILPLVMDDMREHGSRDSIFNLIGNEKVRMSLNNYNFGRKLLNEHKLKKNKDIKKFDLGLQTKTEYYLNNQISELFILWRDRALLRSEIFGFLYNLRNFIFNVNSQTVRKMLPAIYERNIEALKTIFEVAKNNNIIVIPYIVPIRNDFPIPYNIKSYKKFKVQLKNISSSYGFNLLNFENNVPNMYWGFNKSISLGSNTKGVDFMHFQGMGHKILAREIIDNFNSKILAEERNKF